MARKNSKKGKANASQEGLETLNRVMAGFRLQGKSLYKFCEENNLDRRNTTHAVLEIWKGKKAKIRRDMIIEASQANKLLGMQIIHNQKISY